MPCYKPLTAWQQGDGSVVFVERMGKDVRRELSLPCGQCIGCRLERSRQWAMRCMHEASMYERNSFITLTYDDAHLPKRGKLDYPEYQRFMKRLRFKKGEVRFYMCGEYGGTTGRPHYHACLFGMDFDDKKYFTTLPSGAHIYRSAELEQLWKCGNSSIGDVTFESAAYVARYCVQKVTGKNADDHYRRRDADGEYFLPPEFNVMSRRPGIGKPFLDKWKSDIYPHDYVIVRGQKMKPPKFYDQQFKASDPDTFEQMQFERERLGRANWEDNTPARLGDKAEVAAARAAFLKRSLE